MIKHLGFRGYISSRNVLDNRVPQHVQNLVIRDYCASQNMHFLLSVTEYAMPNCYIMLEHALKEAVNNQGVVLYSLFQLPRNSEKRNRIYNLILENQIEIHAALEGLVIKDKESVQRVEDIWLVQQTVCPDYSREVRTGPSGKSNNGFFSGFLDYGRN